MNRQLNEFVNFIRTLNNRNYKYNSITGEIVASNDYLLAIQGLDSSVEVDYPELANGFSTFEAMALAGSNDIVEVTVRHNKNPSSTLLVYKNMADVFKRHNPFVNENGLLDEFYLFEEDLHYPVEDNDHIKSVKSLLHFISCLTKLSMYKDVDKKSCSLVFIGYDKDRYASPVAIDTSIAHELLESVPNDFEFSLLEKLCDESQQKSDIHFESKLSIFNSTMSEFLSDVEDRKDSFKKLLSSWPDFVNKYQKNLSIFTSGYVFGKIKHELAEKEIEVADSFSKVLSDISTKVLSIPISLLIVFFVRNLTDVEDFFLAVFALLLLSVFVFLSILGQKNNYDRVVQAKDIYFDKVYADSKASKEVSSLIDEVEKGLSKNQQFVGFVINVLKYAAWLPFLAGLLYIGFKFDFLTMQNIELIACLFTKESE